MSLVWSWGCTYDVSHVPSALNEADAPSRSSRFAGVRLRPGIWAELHAEHRFTLDGMSSLATRQGSIPYVAVGPDPGTDRVDLFAQDVRGERMWVYPPFVLAPALSRWLPRSGCSGVVLLPRPMRFEPAWFSRFRALPGVAPLGELADGYAEVRGPKGWEVYVRAQPCLLYSFDFVTEYTQA